MKLTIKTLQQQVLTLDVEPSTTVKGVKESIQGLQGYPVEHQKLIYSGKILADDKPVGEYNIAEKDFLVVMVTKPKTAAPAAASSAAPAEEKKAPASPPKPAAAPAPAAAAPSPPTGAPAAPGAPGWGAPALATGPQYEAALAGIVDMGFPREEAVRALRAAFNNPDRAVEYLMNVTAIDAGLKESTAPPASQPQAPAGTTPAPAAAAAPAGNVNLFEAAAAAAQGGNGGGQRAAPGGAGGAGGLEFLRNTPQFQQLRQLIQSNPQLLQPLLQQLGASNPQLLSAINSNQEAFLNMLNEGADGEMGDFEEGDGEQQVIHITPDEDAAIQRLVALGFDRALAIEAFFACDKNEEIAANYLFDHGTGDDWQ